MLPSAPRSSPGAEACRAIEADLGAISPGRAAAGGSHGQLLRKASELFAQIMSHILMQRAFSAGEFGLWSCSHLEKAPRLVSDLTSANCGQRA